MGAGQGLFEHLRTARGGGVPNQSPPLSDWAKFFSGPSAIHKLCQAPVSLGQNFSSAASAPLKHQHRKGVGGVGGRDALEGKAPQRRPQRRLGRRLEEVAKAVRGGRLLSVTNSIEAGTCRQRNNSWAWAGRPGGGVPPPLQCIPWGGGGAPSQPPWAAQALSYEDDVHTDPLGRRATGHDNEHPLTHAPGPTPLTPPTLSWTPRARRAGGRWYWPRLRLTSRDPTNPPEGSPDPPLPQLRFPPPKYHPHSVPPQVPPSPQPTRHSFEIAIIMKGWL